MWTSVARANKVSFCESYGKLFHIKQLEYMLFSKHSVFGFGETRHTDVDDLKIVEFLLLTALRRVKFSEIYAGEISLYTFKT